MKKIFIFCIAAVLIAGCLIWTGCSKKDTTPPVIILNGSNPVYVSLGSSYSDAGATATDDVDGTITSNIVTKGLPIPTNVAGTYTVYYDVSDKAGNAAAEVTRTVYVQNDAANYAGVYNETTQCGSTQSVHDTVSFSNTVDNRIVISDFGLNMTASIYADISSSNLTIPMQTVGTQVYWGTGIITNTGHLTLSINFNDSTIGGSNMQCQSTYTKQ